nr:unnamed protein product [Callosobruchus analis]
MNKVKREKGLDYTGKRKYNGKWSYDIPKSKKILTNPCTNEGVYGSQLGKIGQIAGSGKKIQRQKRRSEKKQLSEQEPEVTVKA